MSPRAQPRGKLANWGNSFLPGAYAGSYVNIQQMKPDAVMRNLKNSQLSRAEQRKQADLKKKCDALRDAIAVKQNNLQAVVMHMQEKMMMMAAAQQEGAEGQAAPPPIAPS